MKELSIYEPPLNDEKISAIASCIDKIEKLKFEADEIKIDGLAILTTAINNRPTPVS